MDALQASAHLAVHPLAKAHQGGVTQTCTTLPSDPRWQASTLGLSALCRGVASPPPSPQGAWGTTLPQALATVPPAQVCVRPKSCARQQCLCYFLSTCAVCKSLLCCGSLLWLCFPCVYAWVEMHCHPYIYAIYLQVLCFSEEQCEKC